MSQPGAPPARIRRSMIGLAIGALSLGAGTITALSDPVASSASAAPSAVRQSSGVAIELIEQEFTLGAGDELRLVYRLSGTLDASADIAPATTTTTTATTTTTTTVPPTDPGAPIASTTTPLPSVTTAAPAPTTTVPPRRTLTVDVANFATITDIDDANRLLGDRAAPGAFRDNIDGVRIPDVRAAVEVVDANTALLTVTLPTDVGGDSELSGPDSLEFPTPGVYPLRMQLLIDDDLIGTHGTLVERRAGVGEINRPAEPVQFAIVTAAERPPGTGGNGDTAAAQRADDILAAAAQIDPPLLASIPPGMLTAALDGAAGDDITETVADDEFVALSDINLDVSSAVAAGIGDRYTQALERGEDSITAALSRPPTRVVRVVDTALSAPGAQLLRTLGVRYLLMTPNRYDDFVGGERPDTDRFVDVELPDGGTLPILLTDPISQEFAPEQADATLATSTETEWAIRTVAAVILDHRSQGRTVRRSKLIGLDDLAPPDPRLINAFVAMATTTPDIDVVAPTALVGTTDTQRAPGGTPLVLPDVAGPDLTARLATIEATTLNLISTASMLDDGDERLPIWLEQLDVLLSNGVSDAAATAVIEGVAAEASDIRSALTLPNPFTFTLTGRSDNIPLRLTNNSDERLNVMVQLTSAKLTFPENNRIISLRANDSTDIQVPVRARSNGTSPVSIQLLTPVGEPLGDPVSLTARVNSLTGLGQVLTGGLLLMLGAWWFASWRKRRADPEPADATAP
jgi:hypothetical protein